MEAIEAENAKLVWASLRRVRFLMRGGPKVSSEHNLRLYCPAMLHSELRSSYERNPNAVKCGGEMDGGNLENRQGGLRLR